LGKGLKVVGCQRVYGFGYGMRFLVVSSSSGDCSESFLIHESGTFENCGWLVLRELSEEVHVFMAFAASEGNVLIV
jgi:hypothetical protein